MNEPAIRNISDTARWVAVYRAMESERPDALFHDPFARRLAGERGEQIVRSLKRGQSAAWSMIVRTAIFDEILLRLVEREGVRTVLNLAAGLDARPYRLALPASLRWVEVDLPEILDYKEQVLAGEQPVCRVERVRLDLADHAERRRLFARLAAEGGLTPTIAEGGPTLTTAEGGPTLTTPEGGPTLAVTEGLLVYLPAPEVAALAADLAAADGFRWWLTDLVSPTILRYIKKGWSKSLDAAQASFQFAPAEGADFFRPYGWEPAEFRPFWLEAKRLHRKPPMAWIFELMGLLRPKQTQDSLKTGALLLERDASPARP